MSFESAPGAWNGGHDSSPIDLRERVVRSRSGPPFPPAAAVVGAVVLTALYHRAQLISPVSGAPKKVIVVFKTIDYLTTPFWGNVRDGVISAGEDFGVDVSIRGPATESDVQGQIDIVRQAIRGEAGRHRPGGGGLQPPGRPGPGNQAPWDSARVHRLVRQIG